MDAKTAAEKVLWMRYAGFFDLGELADDSREFGSADLPSMSPKPVMENGKEPGRFMHTRMRASIEIDSCDLLRRAQWLGKHHQEKASCRLTHCSFGVPVATLQSMRRSISYHNLRPSQIELHLLIGIAALLSAGTSAILRRVSGGLG